MCLLRVQKLNPLLLHPWNISLIQMVDDFAFFFLSFVRTVPLSWLQPVFDSCFRFKAGSFRGHSGLKPTLSPISLFLPTPGNLSQPTFSRLWKILICVSLGWKFIISYLARLKRFFPIFYKVHWSLNGKEKTPKNYLAAGQSGWYEELGLHLDHTWKACTKQVGVEKEKSSIAYAPGEAEQLLGGEGLPSLPLNPSCQWLQYKELPGFFFFFFFNHSRNKGHP